MTPTTTCLFGKRTCGQRRKSEHYNEMLLSQPNRGEAACGAPLHDALNPAQAGPARRSAALSLSQLALCVLALAAWTAPLQAGTLYLPNASFESPVVPPVSPYAGPDMDSWQKSAQPAWYYPSNNFDTPWDYLMGT